MKDYIKKMKKINGSGQCALMLIIAEKILQYEELKIESDAYNFAKEGIKVYWYWLNGKIVLEYNDIYTTIGEDSEFVPFGDQEDFSTDCMIIYDKYGRDSDICNKYHLILSIFLILAMNVQGKELEYDLLDIYDLGDIDIQDFIEKVLEQKIITEQELYLLLDYLSEKYTSYCNICRKSLLSAIKNRNRIHTKKGYKKRMKMFIRKGYKRRNLRRTNTSGQCALVLMLAEKALNNKKLNKTEDAYQFAKKEVELCWKWLNGEIKGDENIDKAISTYDENKNINLWDFCEQEYNFRILKKARKGLIYGVICRAIYFVREKALLEFDEYNYIENTLWQLINNSTKSYVLSQKELNNLIDYLDNEYYNYPNISKSEMMNLLENRKK